MKFKDFLPYFVLYLALFFGLLIASINPVAHGYYTKMSQRVIKAIDNLYLTLTNIVVENNKK